MQWQHGSATYNTDGTMTLNPIVADGRQLLSQPCNGDNAIYSRYNQTETIKVPPIPRAMIRRQSPLTCACSRHSHNISTLITRLPGWTFFNSTDRRYHRCTWPTAHRRCCQPRP